MIKIYMAMEPDNSGQTPRRVAIQTRPFVAPFDFPPAHPIEQWELREGEINELTMAALLDNELDGDEQDRIHRELWTKSGETPWAPL